LMAINTDTAIASNETVCGDGWNRVRRLISGMSAAGCVGVFT